jgi:hypothetical protein
MLNCAGKCAVANEVVLNFLRLFPLLVRPGSIAAPAGESAISRVESSDPPQPPLVTAIARKNERQRTARRTGALRVAHPFQDRDLADLLASAP